MYTFEQALSGELRWCSYSWQDSTRTLLAPEHCRVACPFRWFLPGTLAPRIAQGRADGPCGLRDASSTARRLLRGSPPNFVRHYALMRVQAAAAQAPTE